MKKTRKGFTLVELIIVLAIFSIIMFSVVQLLDPVSKFFVRSSNFENTTACVDNMRRCIEGNLRYADRVRGYAGYMPYSVLPTDESVNTAPQPSKPGHAHVQTDHSVYDHLESFYNTFFKDRKFLDTSGSIYVLVFDNTRQITDSDLADLGTLTDFSDVYGNSGKIVQFEFQFDNYDTNLDEFDEVWATCSATPWVVNQKLYGAFEYRFQLGDIDDAGVATLTGEEDVYDENDRKVTFNPQDFAVSIFSNEVRRQDGGLARILDTDKNTSSFAMKNVLDSTKRFAAPLMDNKTLIATLDEETPGHTYKVEKKTRYTNIDTNPVSGYYDADNTSNTAFDGFYFIYTMPRTTHSNSMGYEPV